MVDFNAKETIGTPAVDIVRLLWLQARDNLLQDWEKYRKAKLEGHEPTLYLVQSRLTTLFYEMQAYLERTVPPIEAPKGQYSYADIERLIFSNDITEEEVKGLIKFFNIRLDKIMLIKIDTKQAYNKFKVEEENKIMGLD